MEEGRDADGLEGGGLAGSPPRDEGHRGSDVVDHLELGFTDLRGDESEDADPPGPVPEQLGRLGQQRSGLVSAQEGQGQEGKGAAVGDGLGEGGPVADPGHRTLGHRIDEVMGGGQGGPRCQGPGLEGGGEVGVDGVEHGLDHSTGGLVPGGQIAGEGAVLANADQLVLKAPVPEQGLDLLQGRRLVHPGGQDVGSQVDAVAGEHPGLAAVHGADGRGQGRGEAADRFPHQGQLGVEDHSRCTTGDRCRRGVGADAAPDPDGHVDQAQHLLEEYEGTGVPDPATALGADHDEAVGPGVHGGVGLVGRDDLHHQPVGGLPPAGHVGSQCVGVAGDDHRVEPVAEVQVGGPERAATDPETEGGPYLGGDLFEDGASGVDVPPELDEAEPPAAGDRDGNPGVQCIEWCVTPDAVKPRAIGHGSAPRHLLFVRAPREVESWVSGSSC